MIRKDVESQAIADGREDFSSSRKVRSEVQEILSELNGTSDRRTDKVKKKKKVSSAKRDAGSESLSCSFLSGITTAALLLEERQGLKSYSAIIFVSTCNRCQQTAAILRHSGIDCVALHSIMTQRERLDALARFKNTVCRILIATDVASRGLDIPTGAS